MKIIDLINKINNNEEVPGEVKYEETIFKYNKERKEYIHELNDWCSETLFKAMNENTYYISDFLRAEVEITEENKEIEELGTLSPQSETNKSVTENRDKINELVRAINKINKERKEK